MYFFPGSNPEDSEYQQQEEEFIKKDTGMYIISCP